MTHTSRPGGCFLDTGNPSKVDFNSFNPSAAGAASVNAQPLCRFGASLRARVRVYSFRVTRCGCSRGRIQYWRGDGAALTPAVVRHACAATYATNDANTNVCAAGYAKIMTEATCEAAAAFLGKPYGSVFALSSKPSGCILRYLTFNAPMVYLNTDPTGGAAAADAQPLCKGTGAPFQIAAPRAHTLGVTPWGGVPRQWPSAARALREYRVPRVVPPECGRGPRVLSAGGSSLVPGVCSVVRVSVSTAQV